MAKNFFETDIGRQIKETSDTTPLVVKILFVACSIISFRATLDYFGLVPYFIAFGLGAGWLLSVQIIVVIIYSYMTMPEPSDEPENAFPEVTMGDKLYQKIHAKQPNINEVAKRDKESETRIKGKVVVQLEGSASDAAKIPVEFRGSTLFVTNLNGNPNVQAIVIEGAYMRQLDERTLEIIHPTRSMWQKEDYIYLKFTSSPKRQYWQSALSLVCKKYSDIYQNPEHFEATNEMMTTFNSLIKEYENVIAKNPGAGQHASTVINAVLHRVWINITNSKEIRKSLLDKLIEKIDVKMTFAAEAGKADKIREIAITDLNLGTRVPFFKDLRIEPCNDKDSPNRDFVLRTHLAYVDGNMQIAVRINVKHSIPLLPMIFDIVAVVKHFELDLKITAVAHPMKRFEICSVEEPLVDLDLLEGGGDIKKLRKIPGWESWGKDKVKKLFNEAIQEKLSEILVPPERQYVNMPGVDSDDEDEVTLTFDDEFVKESKYSDEDTEAEFSDEQDESSSKKRKKELNLQLQARAKSNILPVSVKSPRPSGSKKKPSSSGEESLGSTKGLPTRKTQTQVLVPSVSHNSVKKRTSESLKERY